jgi:predicted permease
MLADLRHALRTLRRAPAFALATALTLALGLGAITTLFTAVRGVLLRPLPFPHPEQLVQLAEVSASGDSSQFADPNFLDVQRQARTLGALAQYQSTMLTVTGGAEAERVMAASVSRDFLAVMQVRPVLGRDFVADERAPGAAPAVLVSEGYWRRALGASSALGRLTIQLDGRPHTVVGVLPEGFAFPDKAELWLPRELDAPLPSRTAHNWRVVARLRDGVAPAAAQRELSLIARGIRREYGSDVSLVDAAVVPLHEQLVGRARPVLLLLFGGAVVLLLVAAANVATLLLARSEAGRRDLSVRTALGAPRARLLRQFFAETGVLAAAGGAAGVLLAVACARLLAAAAPSAIPRVEAVRADGAVLAFAVATVALLVAVLGGATGWRATRPAAVQALGERSGTGGRDASRGRALLVGTQVALTAVLLVGAGLLARSYLQLTTVDPGFRTQGTVAVSVSLPGAEDSVAERRQRLLGDALLARLRQLPGVRVAGAVSILPVWGGSGGDGTFLLLTRPDEVRTMEEFSRLAKDPARVGEASYRRATDGYFEAMGIPLVRGRVFEARDGIDAPPVAVISASVARTRFAGRDPIGQLIQFGNMDGDVRPFTIVGVVGDVREEALDGPARPTIYALTRQRPPSRGFVVVLAGAAGQRLDVTATAAAARRAVREVDPTLPVRVRPIEEVFARALANRRYALGLAAAFAAAALALAATGLYGVVAYLVAQRRRELGVRMALGARAVDVRRLVLGRGLTPAVVGLGVGLAAALAGGRVLAAQLYGVRPVDPATFAGVALLLLAVALLAAWGPARRAARTDPARILRAD